MTKFQDYFTEQVKNFNECHSRLLIEITEGGIHKLRTTIKRLKTFNILLDGLLFRQKDFPIELNDIFKMIGEIRDIQIQQKILQDYEIEYKKYLNYLYETKLSNFKIKDNFEVELQYLNDKLDKVEDYHIDEQIIENIKSRIELGYDEIRNMNISPEILHEIRIKLKRIYYTLLMLGEKNEELYNIQDIIGLWHDYDVTINNIKSFDSDFLDVLESLENKRDLLYAESIDSIKTL